VLENNNEHLKPRFKGVWYQGDRIFSSSREHRQGVLAACGESAPEHPGLAMAGGGWLALEQGRDGSQALGLLRPSGWCRVVMASAAPPAVGARQSIVQVRYTLGPRQAQGGNGVRIGSTASFIDIPCQGS
jgi:hypothetical protein